MNENILNQLKKISGLLGIAGVILALEHKLENGRWTDGKLICHGSLGIGLASLSFLVTILDN